MDIQQIAAEIGSSQELRDLAAKVGISPAGAQAIIQAVLAHTTSGGSPATVVSGVASHSGVDPGRVQQFLPSIMGLLQRHAANAPPEAQGELGGLIGSVAGVLGGAPSPSDGGLLGVAESLFERR
ncbi:MAG: hypothetical protein JWO83_3207 [Caulobacteraceae bacterium]|jgi:hypothetical protein|nr:hypothetical protein [Caulobacteraceae bacterium]